MICETWDKIFSKVDILNRSKPIDLISLHDPENDIVKFILYVQSMETFITSSLNTASNTGDISKADNIGPYAMVLGEILWKVANNCKPLISEENPLDLYRCTILSQK